MKQPALIIFLFWISLCKLSAQNPFYYSLEGTTIGLIENPYSLTIHFKQAHNLSKGLGIEYPSYEGIRNSERGMCNWAVLDFSEKVTNPAKDMIEILGLNPEKIESITPGLTTEDGANLWLTPKIFYELKDNISLGDWQEFINRFSILKEDETFTGLPFLEVSEISEVIDIANEIYESGLVKWAQPDFIASARTMSGTPVTPSDTHYSLLYYLNNTGMTINFGNTTADVDINAPEAWCETTGDPAIVVAIVDVGVEPHEDLKDDPGTTDRVLNGYTTSNPTENPGGRPIDDTALPEGQKQAHGQAVAGIIAASHNTIGVSGIAPEVQILPVHVFVPIAPVSEYADGINWAWQNGADVINNSWVFGQCTGSFATIETAITSAITLGRGGKGCVVMFSTGQEVTGSASNVYDCVAYPANLSDVIAMGAIDGQGNYPSYANYGPELDLVAPTSGSSVNNITTIDREGELGYNFTGATLNYADLNYNRWFGGTSTACAIGSGVAALILSKNPALTVSEVRNIMESTARTGSPINISGNQLGNGMIDAQAALSTTPDPVFPVNYTSFTGKWITDHIQLHWETATEVNNDFFEVRKMVDGKYTTLGVVKGAGTTYEPASYQFIDRNPVKGPNTYQLVQHDLNGDLHRSSLVEVYVSDHAWANTIRLYPNPTSNELNLVLSDMANKQVKYTLLNVQGKAVLSGTEIIPSDQYKLTLDVSSLSPGAYLVEIEENDSIIEVLKCMIAK